MGQNGRVGRCWQGWYFCFLLRIFFVVDGDPPPPHCQHSCMEVVYGQKCCSLHGLLVGHHYWMRGGCAVYLLRIMSSNLVKKWRNDFFHDHWGQGGYRTSLQWNTYLRHSRCKSFLTSLFFLLLGINKKIAILNIRIWNNFFVLEAAKRSMRVPRIFWDIDH